MPGSMVVWRVSFDYCTRSAEFGQRHASEGEIFGLQVELMQPGRWPDDQNGSILMESM